MPPQLTGAGLRSNSSVQTGSYILRLVDSKSLCRLLPMEARLGDNIDLKGSTLLLVRSHDDSSCLVHARNFVGDSNGFLCLCSQL